MPRASTFKSRLALSASLMIFTIAISGCSLTAKKPEVAATSIPAPRASSAAEAMQQAAIAKQQRQTKNSGTPYVDPLVSARPGQKQPEHQNTGNQAEIADGQNVRDFRASGRSAMASMRSEKTLSAKPAQAQSPKTQPAVPELTESAMAGIVTQPTVIQAGRNSIFSAAASPAADLTASGETASAPHVSSATGSLSTDAVAYAPVRRISGTAGGLFGGNPQMASNANVANASAPAAANHTPPGIATRPAASTSAAAEPVVQGLW